MSGRKSPAFLCSLTVGVVFALGSAAAWADVEPVGPTTETITTTIVFDVKHPAKLERYIRWTVTPGSPHYRDFLSLPEFVVHYAPHKGQLKQVERYLAGFGITVDKIYADQLAMNVSGPASAFENAFDTQLVNYQETQPDRHPHRRQHFHRPTNPPHIPKLLRANDVLTIVGLSNEYQFQPLHKSLPQARSAATLEVVPSGANTIATGTPGQFTVGDVAAIYNVNPLYDRGIDGAGTAIGIATYAYFDPLDAYTYWDIIGLTSKPNRITPVHVAGGGSADGSFETTLDVEQSGGLAPFADVVVYDAPNSSAGSIQLFYRIVSENRVDSVSYSWGLPEIFYFPGLNGGVDFTDTMDAVNQAFMEAAVQGISVFAASGDSGAYATDRSLPAPMFATPLSVGWPASSPYVTAAGGTTLPVSLVGGCNGTPYYIDVTSPRPWAWDYLAGFYQCIGVPLDGIFAVGGGGGVSVYWARPWYQDNVTGVQTSEPGQILLGYQLPAGFAGRNVPDISMDADPYTGFLVYFGGLYAGNGGTSFVAPQFNGIMALINQRAGSRIGLLNPQIYRLLDESGYGPDSSFNDITTGDNWYWLGVPDYDPASGVGTPNVTRLADALSAEPAPGHGHH